MIAGVMITSVIVGIVTAAAAYAAGRAAGLREAETPQECRKALEHAEAAERVWRKYAQQLEEEIAELEHGTTVTSQWLLDELEKAQTPAGDVPARRVA